MFTAPAFAAASQHGVSATLREPERDIDAQLRALVDENHPKVAVFLAARQSLGDRKLPSWVYVESRGEGTLVTTMAALAAHFRLLEEVTDDHLAALLGYPETKGDVLKSGHGVVVQALDVDGCVVFEAASSHERIHQTIAVASLQTPQGGRVNVTTPIAAISRRIAGMN